MSSSAIRLIPSRYWDTQDVIEQLQPTEPVYLYAEQALRTRANQFLDNFPGTVSYAVKANPESRILDTLSRVGVNHFDVASIDEVRLVAKSCPGAELHFNNPIKSEQAISEAYAVHGVRSFVIDDEAELNKIWRQTSADQNVTYTVRFCLDHSAAAYDFGSKFGATVDQAINLLRLLNEKGVKTALTFHPGSQCTNADMYDEYLKAAADIAGATDTKLEFINVGGGFPEQYLDTIAPSLETYFDVISRASKSYFNDSLPLICEPGRAMVGSCASLLTQVIHVRTDNSTIYINDGIYGGLQEQSLVKLDLPLRVWRGDKELNGLHADFTIFGPTCDPMDKLPRPKQLPMNISTGDYIEFGLLGAYGSTTTTRFNGFESSTYLDVHHLSQWWLSN